MARRTRLPSFAELAAEENERLEAEERARIALQGVGDIADYVPKLSPTFARPTHLEPMLRYVRKYDTEPFRIVFSVPPRHGKPLAEDTPVRMADGTTKPVRQVRVGDRVVSGTGRPTTVSAVYPQGYLPVWRVRTASGHSFRAEGSHRFLTAARGWVRVDELRARPRRADALVRCEGYALDAPGQVVPVPVEHRPWGERLPVGAWVPDAVVELAPAGRALCFCLTVVEDESFLVSGDYVTHNTETLLHVVPWVLRKYPNKRIGYATYSLGLARKQALKVQRLCRSAGIRMATTKVMDWETPEGGGFVATGIGGMMTGMGFDILIVDDPTKDRATAESRIYRDRAFDWFTSTAYTRLMPGGSVIVCGTRWHEDDLQGRLIKGDPITGRPAWPYVNLPAIADDPVEAELLGRELGSALWPEMWPVEVLRQNQLIQGPYNWASLYQGRPQPRGGSIFGDPHFWNELPQRGYRVGLGVDLAYTDNTKRDYAVAVLGWYVPAEDTIYVMDVLRVQMKAPEFKAALHARFKAYTERGVATWRFYGAGPEKGSVDFMCAEPNAVPLTFIQASTDKYVRATPYSASWNASKVLLPGPEFRERMMDEGREMVGYPWDWLGPFVSEHVNFTGNKRGEVDDQVDAGAAMHDVLRPARRPRPAPEPITEFTAGPWTR